MKDLQIQFFGQMKTHFSALNGDAPEKNYLEEWAKTRLTSAELADIKAGKADNEAIQKRIEGDHETRILKTIEGKFKAEQFRGVWTRAEDETIEGLYKSQGGDMDALAKHLEGVEEKGKFKAIVKFIANNHKSKLDEAKKESGNASAERVAQLNEQNAAALAANKALKAEFEAYKVEADKRVENTALKFEIDAERGKIAGKMFSSDSEKKIITGITQNTLLTVAKSQMDSQGLTERKEGDKIIIFKGDKALQIEGTSHNHTIETYLDSVAASNNWYQKGNANPNNNKPGKGVVIDAKDEKYAALHPTTRARLAASGKTANNDQF